jgi:hypothetical protein
MVRVVDASPVQEGTLKECRASSGRYWASLLIKRLRVTTGEQSLQARNRKTRILRHAGGYKEFLVFAGRPYNVYGVIKHREHVAARFELPTRPSHMYDITWQCRRHDADLRALVYEYEDWPRVDRAHNLFVLCANRKLLI